MSRYYEKDETEKGVYGKDDTEVISSSVPREPHFYDPSKESIWTRLGLSFESYKRAPGTTGGQVIAGDAGHVDLLREGENPMLQQKMKPRHLTMIAVGGSIGTGLFIGTGSALNRGGPAGVLIAFVFYSSAFSSTRTHTSEQLDHHRRHAYVFLFARGGWQSSDFLGGSNVTQALGEMAILYPVSGGFYALAVRFLDPAYGMAFGWNYLLQWAVVLPLEIVAAAITVEYWPSPVPTAAWFVALLGLYTIQSSSTENRITIFYVIIILVNIFGTLGFAEEEFWSSCLKLTVVIIFIITGIVLNVGGGPANGEFASKVGGRYWSNPGALANGFKGVCSVFVTAAFSFAGTELVGLAATETPNPRKVMPGAVKQTFWRITIIYITSLTIIGVNVPYTEPRLLGGGGAAASPFVIMVDRAGINGLNHLINVTICISVLSIGLSCVYAGSRVLTTLAEHRYAPSIFTYVDKSGRPLMSVLFLLLWGPIAYVTLAANGDEAFDWLVAISGLSTLFSWGSICLCHIRFRAAWKAQGHSLEELPFRAMGGVYGSWLGFILVVLVLIAQFYVAVWPLGPKQEGGEAAITFFKAYLAFPVILMFWIIGYAWKRERPRRAHEIDLDTGRKSWLTVEEMRAWRAERATAPFYVKIWRILFSN